MMINKKDLIQEPKIEKPEFTLKDLKFEFDLSKTNYQLDRLQNKFLEFYLRNDERFRRAFYSVYTNDFIGFIRDKAKLREPIHLSIMGTTRGGKCLKKGSQVLMANGEWKNIENIDIGDLVLSPQKDGKNIFSKVIGISKHFSRDNYKVYEKNNNNLLFECSKNHLIPNHYRGTLRIDKKDENSKRKANWYFKDVIAKDLFERPHSNNSLISSFPILKFNNRKNCKINPYILGFYLGDGHFTKSLGITTSNEDIIKYISKIYSFQNINHKKTTLSKTYLFSKVSKFANLLKKYGLKNKKSKDKFIPKEALLSNINYRRKLLAGLIDTDGSISRSCAYSITTKSKQLANDILFLIKSLGGYGHIYKRISKIKSISYRGFYYKISFYLAKEIEKIPILKRYKQRKKYKSYWKLSANRVSFKLKKSKPQIVYGIEIDSPSRWFITDNFIVTHNSYTAMSLCAIHQACYGKKFSAPYICANSMEYLQKIKEMSPEQLHNRIFLIDEQQENLMGVGSISKKLRLKDVANIIAMSNISTIQLNPIKFANTDAFYGLRLFGKCFETKTTRSMLYNLQESAKLIPVGNIYLPIFTALLPKSYAEPLEKAYLDRKRNWIELERTGQNDELAHLRRKYAKDFMKDKQFLSLAKKNEQLSYIKGVMGSGFTSGEIEDIFQLTKLFRQGIKFEEDN